MAQRKRSAGKPGKIKYGSPEWDRYQKRKERERRKRAAQGKISTARSRKQRGTGGGMAGGKGDAGPRRVRNRGAK